MTRLSSVAQFRLRVAIGIVIGLLVCLSAALGGIGAIAFARAAQNAQSKDGGGGMAHMAGHMSMTTLRPPQPGDQQKADAIVADARKAMEPYQDYRKALADGYEIFLPNLPQPQYHFTNHDNGLAARTHFDPLKPTSLLYKKTPDGGYKLVGAMYTDRFDASEEDLNERIPLSVARWHQHVNFCKAPAGQKAAYFGPDGKFGLLGSINTKERAKRRVENSSRMFSDGWSTSIPTRPTRRKFGQPTMTTRAMTTWTARRCQA